MTPCFRRAALLHLVLVAMTLLVACAHPYAPAPYPPAPPSAILDMLLADYRALGLPLPPPDARLVRWELTRSTTRIDGKLRPLWHLAFELPSVAGDRRPWLLVGTDRITPTMTNDSKVVPVQPTAEAVEGIQGELDNPWWSGTLHRTNAALATAIQAKARGWDAVAERLLELASKTRMVTAGCNLRRRVETPRQALALLAAAHLTNEQAKPGADWGAIAPRLEAALAFDAFTLNCTFDWSLRQLRRTLEHRRAAPGTIEAEIDALCYGEWSPGGDGMQSPALFRIAEKGFDAVPALIDHLNDERLMRRVQHEFDGTSHQFLLGWIVTELLRDIAGLAVDDPWVDPRNGISGLAAVRAWWAQAQAMGEEAYVVAHVFPAAVDGREPNGVVLRILARKYPRRLEEAYRTALARPHMSTRSIADAIAASALPEADRRRLLLQGAESATPAHRSAALHALRSFDHKPDGGGP